jgi:adenosine deaminase
VAFENDFAGALEEAVRGEMKKLNAFPKADLHAHSALSAPLALYRKFPGAKNPDPPARFEGGLQEFIGFFTEHFSPLIATSDFLVETTRGCFEQMRSDGVTYTETSIDLRFPLGRGLRWPDIAPELRSEVERAFCFLSPSLELGVPRNVPEELWREHVFEALETGIFDGIDIYDDELSGTLARFRELFDFCRKRNLRIKVHTGEAGAPDQIRADLADAAPDAIQHGVRAAEDPALMRSLADAGIPLHVCVASNIALRVCESVQRHPIRKLFDAGVKVTLNSDDYAIFGRSVSDDFKLLYQEKVFTAAELDTIRRTGLSQQATG